MTTDLLIPLRAVANGTPVLLPLPEGLTQLGTDGSQVLTVAGRLLLEALEGRARLSELVEDVDPEEVLRLDEEATPGPWQADHAWWPGEVTDEYAAVGPAHTLRKYDFPDLDTPEKRAALDVAMMGIRADEKLIAYYRTAAPALARALIAERQKVNDATREAREEGIRVGQDTAAYQLEDLLAGRPLGDPAYTEPLVEALRRVAALRGQVAEALAALPEDTKRIEAELRAENERLRKEIDATPAHTADPNPGAPYSNPEQLRATVNAERIRQRMSWRDLANALDIAPSGLTRWNQGRMLNVPAYLKLCDWLRAATLDRNDAPKPK